MRNNNRRNNKKDQTIMNERIRAKEVRLIDENGDQAGVIDTREALIKAENVGLDLVLISPNANPPVAKIIDYGKYKYDQEKKKKEAKAKQKKIVVKEVRLSPTIDEHDYQTKLNNAKKFLAKGNKVQFSLRFRGRMITHSEFGYEVMNRVVEDLGDEVTVDQKPKMDGRKMFVLVSPVNTKK